MALTLNPYQAPVSRGASLAPHPVEFDFAGFARRMGVQAVAGLATYAALCLPLHFMAPLFWEGTITPYLAGLVVLSTVTSAALLDLAIRQVQPLWLVAMIQVLLNGSLFGMAWASLAGLILGGMFSALSMHLTLPVACVAMYAARAWTAPARSDA
jgi:hypothetical protein